MLGRLLEEQRLIAQRAFSSAFRRPRLDRPLRTLIDPRPQHRDGLIRQHVFVRWHFHVRLQVRHEQYQRTLGTLAGHNRRPIGTSALQRRRKRVKPQPALLFVRPVT